MWERLQAVDVPAVRYARCGEASLAYQQAGEGTGVLLVGGSSGSSATWADPTASQFFRQLTRFCCLVTFEQQGAGLSDPLGDGRPQTLEERVADTLGVLEAATLERPFVVAVHDGGPVALLMVTSRPEMFRGLILINTAPRLRRAPDYEGGVDERAAERFVEQMRSKWGTGWSVDVFAPSFAALPGGRERWARIEQAACSPRQAVLQTEQAFATDARHLLPLVTIPTLVVHRREDTAVPAGTGRYLADRIGGSWLVELPGRDHFPWTDKPEDIVGAIRWFVGQEGGRTDDPRRLAAVVFTDIVRSTETLARVGDERWTDLLDVHDAAARRLAAGLDGQLVKSTGDGTLCWFRGPAQAIRYAVALRDEIAPLGLNMRAGVHAGEVVMRHDDVAGIAVHAAARVAALAPDSEVYVSRTITDLVVGSGLTFTAEGTHVLRGLPGTWEIYSVNPDDPNHG